MKACNQFVLACQVLGAVAALTLASGCATSPRAGSDLIGLPPSLEKIAQRQSVTSYPASAGNFQQMDRFFPAAIVKAKPRPEFDSAPAPLPNTISIGGKSVQTETVLAESDTNVLLVLKDGKIVHERYFNGATPDTRFVGWSISKSVTSLLFGIALEEGAINSINDPVDDYLSELTGTVFEGVSLRHLLEMRAGSDYREQPSAEQESHVDKLVAQSIYENRKRFTDVSELGLSRSREPGKTFNYSTLTTSLLGRVIESATGTSLNTYTSEKLWQPAGMQDDAFWLMDGTPGVGDEWAGGGFNATARDFARLGLLILQKGAIDGHQIVPKEWIRVSTEHSRTGPVIPNTPRGYGYHWWTMIGTDLVEAIGVYGQIVSIDPATNTVIVKLSYWPVRGSGKHAVETHMLLTAIRANLTK